MDKVEKGLKIFSVVIILVIVILLIVGMKQCDILHKQLYELNDSLFIKKNKDGSKTASRQLLQTDINLLLSIKSKDSTIKQLQDEVRKNKDKIKSGGSVITINSETTYSSTAPSVLHINNNDSCNPVYNASNNDTTWVKWKVRSSKDSTTITFSNKDRYTVVIGSERIGLFKRKPIVEITTYNPYNSIRSMRAFEVKDNSSRTRFGLGIQAGYGATLKGLSPYLGIGLNFKIL